MESVSRPLDDQCIEIDNTEKSAMTPQKSSAIDDLIIDENVTVAPVTIEELDESTAYSLNVNMNEFVETTALRVQEMMDICPPSPSRNSNKETLDTEDQDTTLTADEEDRLTKQFLNGELTFSEYSSKMDRDVDLEAMDVDDAR